MPFNVFVPPSSPFRSPRIGRTFSLALVAIGSWLLGFTTSPVHADILVMKDGTRITIEGTWQAKGRQILFTLPGGQLSAVRADEVDLVASQKATAEANSPPPPPPDPAEVKAAKKAIKPVLVLTDKDIPRASDETLPESRAEAQRLEVVDGQFERFNGDPAFRLAGTVVNNSSATVRGVRVFATLVGNAGGNERVVSCEAQIEQPLEPSQREDFSCDISRRDVNATNLPQAFVQAVPRFDIRVGGGIPEPETTSPEPEDPTQDEDGR